MTCNSELQAVARRNITASGCPLSVQTGGKGEVSLAHSNLKRTAHTQNQDSALVVVPQSTFDGLSTLITLAPVVVFVAVYW